MSRRFVTADVFTSTPFAGNPVAVVLDAEGLATAQMQTIAREFNYSETTFVLPPASAASTAHVRIFTPRIEVPFAGHPNIGTAVVLARDWESGGRHAGDRFVFEEHAGPVPLRLIRERGAVVGAELVAPEPLTVRERVSIEAAAACLSIEAGDIRAATHPPQVASIGLPFLIVELATREALRRARPNLDAHERTLPPLGIDAVYAYCRGGVANELHARTFAPLDGCIEDPATGSATAAAIAMLTLADGEPDESRQWQVHQGVDMGRPSLILGRVDKRRGTIAEVRVGGHVVTLMAGVISAG